MREGLVDDGLTLIDGQLMLIGILLEPNLAKLSLITWQIG
jgi:hypothetical protein